MFSDALLSKTTTLHVASRSFCLLHPEHGLFFQSWFEPRVFVRSFLFGLPRRRGPTTALLLAGAISPSLVAPSFHTVWYLCLPPLRLFPNGPRVKFNSPRSRFQNAFSPSLVSCPRSLSNPAAQFCEIQEFPLFP